MTGNAMIFQLVLLIGIKVTAVDSLPQSQSTNLLSSTRRNLYSNLTCPANCTCSHQPRRSSDASNAAPGAVQFETLAPKLMVDCDGISIDNLRDIFASMPEAATSFALRRADLTNLADFCCMEELETLDLSYNRISDLIVYVEFEKLTFLNLRSNLLRILRKDEFISFPNVEILNIDNNEIQVVDQESFRLMRLRQLYLSQNQIAYVNERAFRYAANLEVLNLSGNRLTSIHARNFYFSRKLRSLDLNTNQLTRIDESGFEPLYRLEELNLSYNNLSKIPSPAFQQLNSLNSLILDGNPVSILENGSFLGLSSLVTLSLDRMVELTMILDGALTGLPYLRRLSICNCKKLQYLSYGAFGDGLDSLRELYLTNNGLTFAPASIASLPALEKFDSSGNPFNCECVRTTVALLTKNKRAIVLGPIDPTCRTNDDRLFSLFDSNLNNSNGSICRPAVAPASNSNVNRSIGLPVSLYCAVVSEHYGRYVPVWTLPDGRRITIGDHPHRFRVDHERLNIAFVLQEDAGRYGCSAARIGNGSAAELSTDSNAVYVDLRVDATTSVIVPMEISAYHVTWTWSRAPLPGRDHKAAPNLPPLPISHHHHPVTPPGDCRLMFKSEQDQEFVYADLPSSWERYTVNRLRPETNYSFCLLYIRDDVILYKYCTSIRTDKEYLHFGVSLNYGLVALLAISITLICALCVARCVHKRLHIWQEEKYRGRMQESLSAQGFLSSFESLTSGSLAAAAAASVTYENQAALADCASQNEEAETVLSEPTNDISARLVCRKKISRGDGKKPIANKYSSTVVVETHATA